MTIAHAAYFIRVTHLFCNLKSVPPNPTHIFLSSIHFPPPTPCSGNHLFVLCIYKSVSDLLYLLIFFRFHIEMKSYGTFSLLDSFHFAHPLGLSMLSQMPRFHSLWLSNILYPFIYWWALKLLPYFGSCKKCCNGHKDAYSFQIVFTFFGQRSQWNGWFLW